MKKLSFLALAAAGLLFGACSNDNEIQGVANNPYNLIEGESSWIALGISMPGDEITRANEDLTDGEATEYAVKSGTLYLFKGTNENDAVYFEKYTIKTAFNLEDEDNVPEGNNLTPKDGEITSTSERMVQEITAPELGVDDKLYAYVVLNDQKNVTINATPNTTTGAQFKKQQLKAIGIENEALGYGAIGDGGLVMTSVPIATTAGGQSDPTGANIITFTEINKSAIYKTKAEAEAPGAQMACIYVERAAVKVEVKLGAGFSIKLDGEEKITIPANKVKWGLGNVNFGGTADVAGITPQGYYNTRQFNSTWLPYNNQEANPEYLRWRMVGRTRFFNANHTPNPAFRTYFAEDPNYTGTQPTTHWENGKEVAGYNGKDGYNAYTGLLNAQLSEYPLNPDDITYTYENTFDENSQIFRNTTYVGVQVDINNGNAFYTMQGQPNTKLADVNAIKAVLTTRLSDNINQRRNSIQSAIIADLGKTTAEGRTISEGVTSVTFDIPVAVTLGEVDAETGEQAYTVKLSLDNIKTDGAAASAADQAAVNALAKAYLSDDTAGNIDNPANSKVYKYTDGLSYYTERIKHFGDVETPWGAPAEAYNNYQLDYPANGQQTFGETPVLHIFGTDRANAWLGRWGVVRNNWYVLTLKGIEGIGSPVPVDFSGEAGNTPDDNPPTSYFISAEIHILPWVKRTQDVVF
ncbi:MAG: Mfa1 fimbrilin C-terminal domain-containing protein [Bacteroidaceae bacterium]|nr:Mfa1 fimbrilin C-terminal domain-containing protein [Bacteroidaceae bacterium]